MRCPLVEKHIESTLTEQISGDFRKQHLKTELKRAKYDFQM